MDAFKNPNYDGYSGIYINIMIFIMIIKNMNL